MENEVQDVMAETLGKPTVERKKKNRTGMIAGITALCLLGAAALIAVGWVLDVPAVRYCYARVQLSHGEYEDALEAFEQLGGYGDAQRQAAEAEKGLRYLAADELISQGRYPEALSILEALENFLDTGERIREAKYLYASELAEQGDYEAAKPLLDQIGNYEGASTLLRQMEYERWYQCAMEHMAQEEYLAAADRFEALGSYKDAEEKTQECRWLDTAVYAYTQGSRHYANGKWLEAYRALAPLSGSDYKDTEAILAEIHERSSEYARSYAQSGERGRSMAFLRVLEEINEAEANQLRDEFFTPEAFVTDQTFYMVDTTHIKGFTSQTTKEEFASVVLYMLLNGKLDTAFMSNKTVDFDLLADRALQGCDLAGEILPGYGAIYNPQISIGENYITFHMNIDQAYSEHQRSQHIKTFRQFCEDSVRQLTEIGLLGSNMSYRQKAEVIGNWVCFYLTYDPSLSIHDAGVAVEKKRGVCEAYAALYNRMCNYAGIPTYGQIGFAGPGEDARHIWSFHIDENGEIFYADMTWADSYEIDFGVKAPEDEPTIELFAEHYLERCMKAVLAETSGSGGVDPYRSVYFWSTKLWVTHRPERSAEEIIAYHDQITGKAA